MACEAKEWVFASRRMRKGQSGGIHVYIDSETLQLVLRSVNISSNSRLLVKRYPLKSSGNIAKILISIKEAKQ